MVTPTDSVAKNRNNPTLLLVDMTFFSFESEPVTGPDGVKTTEQRLLLVRGRATAQFSNQYSGTGRFCSEFLYIGEQYQEISFWPARGTRDLNVPINQGHRPSAKGETDVTGHLNTANSSRREGNSRGWDCKQEAIFSTATLRKIREHSAICRRLFAQSRPHVLWQAEEHVGGLGIKLLAGSSKNFLPCLFKRKC